MGIVRVIAAFAILGAWLLVVIVIVTDREFREGVSTLTVTTPVALLAASYLFGKGALEKIRKTLRDDDDDEEKKDE